MRALSLLLLAAVAAAQDPQAPNDLQRLAERVDTAHRPRGREPITAFRAGLLLKQTAADAEARGEVSIEARYLEWTPPSAKAPKSLFRYALAGSSKPVEQGVDRDGVWATEDGKLVELGARDRENDRKNIRSRTNLARQLVRFLDPGAVLRGLQQPTAVQEEALRLGRLAPIPCLAVAGRLAAFPLLQTGGTDAPVAVKVYVHQQTSRLTAIEVWPLDEQGKPDQTHGEFVYFDRQEQQGDVLLPMQLIHYLVGADGKRQQQLQVTIATIALQPKLTAADFDRPTR